MHYVVLDLEWNQPLNYQSRSYRLFGDRLIFEVIQFGAVRLDEDLNISDRLNILVHPVCYPKLHPRIQSMTGITQDLLEDSPFFGEALETFLDWCGEDALILTWGCDDISVLRQNMDFFGCTRDMPAMYDLQLLFQKEHELDNRMNLRSAMELTGLEAEAEKNFHDAGNDAYYTARILQHMKNPQQILDFPETARPLVHPQPHATKGDLFESIAQALESEQALQPRCPVCARPCTLEGSYVIQTGDRYVSLSRCRRHGQMMVTLQFRMRSGMRAMTVRSQKASRANIAYVHTKRLQMEHRAEEGRMPDPELLLQHLPAGVSTQSIV